MMPRPAFLFRRLFGIRTFALFLFGAVMFASAGAASVQAQMPGVLSGVVLAPDGSPQAHARVYLQPGNGRPPRTVLTDATGHFTFGNTVSGIYDVRAQANGLWSELIHNVSVKKNDEVKVKLQIKAAKTAEKR
jgi:Carboxypeptidase regulatory-like domain